MANGLLDPVRGAFAACWRALPRIPGHKPASTAANYLFLGIGCTPIAAVHMRLGHRLRVDLRSWTERYAYYSGIYQDEEIIRAALRLVPADGVALDVGANIGFFTVPLASRAAHVYAFEPLPANFTRLRENLALNGIGDSAVTAVPLGLSSENQRLELTLRGDFEQGGETGNAAIVIDDGRDERFEKVEIEVRTLDGFAAENGLDRIDLVKVDIEGHEDLFLEGGRDVLARTRPIILMEVNVAYFKRRGVDLAERVEATIPADYTYLRRADGSGAWAEIASVRECADIDDAILVPREKLTDALAALAV
ncbi:MAG: FkbM family methyltransferase [Planctomycetota bacterium]|jgi:FkbM family methyltransferase